MSAHDLPITGLCIVADINKCPPNFTVIDKTYGSIQEDADLWKDRMWGRKITRYLCVERGYSNQGDNVMIDVTIINEKDPIPAGFTVIDTTYDTREKAVKKKILCVRWMNKAMTCDGITEIILMGKNMRKPPPGFQLVGELNGLSVCFKIGKIAVPTNNHEVSPANVQSYHDASINMTNLGSSLPYSIHPQTTTAAPSIRPAGSEYSTAPVHALLGVPWQLNPRLQCLSNLKNTVVPDVHYKSQYDIFTQYDYDFSCEKSVCSASK